MKTGQIKQIKRLRFLVKIASIAVLIGLVGSANATMLSISMNTLLNGYYPSPSTSNTTWLTATLSNSTYSASNQDYTTVLSLSASGLGSNFIGGNKNATGNIGWAFSLSDTPTAVATCSTSTCGSSYGPGIAPTPAVYNAPPTQIGGSIQGSYQLAVYFPSGNRLYGGDKANYLLTSSDVLSFVLNSVNLYSVAHVQNSLSCSGWVGATGPGGYTGTNANTLTTAVCSGSPPGVLPEPSDLAMMLYGVGLLGTLLLFAEKSRRRAATRSL